MRKTILIVSILSIVGLIAIANAQQALPKGGNSFETAVKLEPGNYQGGSLDNEEAEYFYITDIKAGQEINIKGTFTAANVEVGAWAILTLYDQDEKEVAVEDYGFYDEPLSLTISQIHRGKDSDKYYIKTECDAFKIASYILEVSLIGEGEEEGLPDLGTEQDETEKKGSNWGLIIGIIVGIIILAIIIYLLLKKKKNK